MTISFAGRGTGCVFSSTAALAAVDFQRSPIECEPSVDYICVRMRAFMISAVSSLVYASSPSSPYASYFPNVAVYTHTHMHSSGA